MLLELALAAALAAPAGTTDCEKDVAFAADELPKVCGKLLTSKKIDWRKVCKPFKAEAKKVKTDGEHWKLLSRLIARLEDGHAYVTLAEGGKGIEWPQAKPQKSPGLFLTVVGKKVYVKNAFGDAAKAGITPGMQVVKVDKKPARKWLDEFVEAIRDRKGFSTDHGALYAACHGYLTGEEGSRMKLELRGAGGKGKKATLMYGTRASSAWGPAVFPKDVKRAGRQAYGKTPKGFGYIHLRKIPETIFGELDKMLGEIGNVPGLILDCRANGGGGCDHGALFGRFVPKGETFAYAGIESAGEAPYGGPMVVIVDSGCLSAGETVSGQFKLGGRAYMIGSGPTAGMSAKKDMVQFPSGKFRALVSIRSHGRDHNKGAGIEGIGVHPHEIVHLDPGDLAVGEDTLIKRAEELLEKGFPKKAKVVYDPAKHGWEPPR